MWYIDLNFLNFNSILVFSAFDLNANIDLFGVREVLAIENEKQANGKVLKKVINYKIFKHESLTF